MRKALYRVCHRLNGILCLGVALLALVSQPVPKTPEFSLAKIDFISDALAAQCKTQMLKRIGAKIQKAYR